MYALVFKNGFVGLTLCAVLAAAPAVAQEQAAPDEPQPPPPSSDEAQPPPSEAESPPPGTDGSPPATSEPDNGDTPERTRVMIRSAPRPAEPLAEEPVQEKPEPRRAEWRAPQEPEAAERPGPAADTFREAITTPRHADAPTPAPVAAAASSAPERAARSDDARSERVAPPQPLPARIVAGQVRRIVEVVPAQIWAVLAGLALLTFALAGSSWAAARKARRLRRQREALLQEVGLLQEALLPAVPAGMPLSVAYRPANGATAGGDFYDAFELPDGRSGVILGDVSGHGRDALARTTFVRYSLRAYLEAGLAPREVLKVGSAALADDLDGELRDRPGCRARPAQRALHLRERRPSAAGRRGLHPAVRARHRMLGAADRHRRNDWVPPEHLHAYGRGTRMPLHGRRD